MKNRFQKISISKLAFILFVTTIIISEFTLSRYSTTLSKQEEATIAVMGSDVSLNILTPSDVYPGSAPAVIPIVITNKGNGKVCDVSQKFQVSLIRSESINIPFEYGLYEDIDCTNLLQKDENGYYTDSSYNFDAGIESSKVLYLKVEWPEEYNQESYAFEIDYVKVKITVTQVD